MSPSFRAYAKASIFFWMRFNILFLGMYGIVYFFDTPTLSLLVWLAICNGTFAILVYPVLLYRLIKAKNRP